VGKRGNWRVDKALIIRPGERREHTSKRKICRKRAVLHYEGGVAGRTTNRGNHLSPRMALVWKGGLNYRFGMKIKGPAWTHTGMERVGGKEKKKDGDGRVY